MNLIAEMKVSDLILSARHREFFKKVYFKRYIGSDYNGVGISAGVAMAGKVLSGMPYNVYILINETYWEMSAGPVQAWVTEEELVRDLVSEALKHRYLW